MEFSFNQEEELFRKSAREFVERYVKPNWVALDDGKYGLINIIRRMGEVGLLGIPFNSKYGGADGSFTMVALATEELAYGDPSLATAVYYLLNNAWPFMVQRYASDAVKEEVLPLVSTGKAFIGIASTEPQGGSDVASFKLEAKRKGNAWALNGEKNIVTGISLIVNDLEEGGFVTIGRTGPIESRHKGLTVFLPLIKRRGSLLPGFEYNDYEEIGRRGLPTGLLRFRDFEVPDNQVLGEVNGGFKIAMEGFDLARTMIAAASIGATKWLLEEGRKWIKERQVFGKPIASYEGVSFKYAELATRLEAAELLMFKAVWAADKAFIKGDGVDILEVATLGAMAKMTAVELAVDASLEVMKWFGGMSYFKELPEARVLLSALSYYVGAEGAANIMRLIVARNRIGKEV
ncbi:MAG: acyl-CoA dehydrogenase family protein [Thermocladium sp.]|jgi:acyl-CoA dehydrogenase